MSIELSPRNKSDGGSGSVAMHSRGRCGRGRGRKDSL